MIALDTGDRLALAHRHAEQLAELAGEVASELGDLAEAFDSAALKKLAGDLESAGQLAAELAEDIEPLADALGSKALARVVRKLGLLGAAVEAQRARFAELLPEGP